MLLNNRTILFPLSIGALEPPANCRLARGFTQCKSIKRYLAKSIEWPAEMATDPGEARMKLAGWAKFSLQHVAWTNKLSIIIGDRSCQRFVEILILVEVTNSNIFSLTCLSIHASNFALLIFIFFFIQKQQLYENFKFKSERKYFKNCWWAISNYFRNYQIFWEFMRIFKYEIIIKFGKGKRSQNV